MGIAAAHTPAHNHQANGGVEKAVRDLKGQVRVMRCAMVRRIGPIAIDSAVFEWLTIWASELLTGARVGHDGMMAFRRLRGRPWEPRLAEFGEQVMARRPGALLQGDAEPRWDQVTYLGSRWGTAEHHVATADGIVKLVRSIRRRSEHERWASERVLEITGTPDDLGRCAGAMPPSPRPPPEVIPHPHPDVELQRPTRGFRIEERDMREHGFTQLCPRCDNARRGIRSGTGHSVECRTRFKAIFKAAGDSRIERAQARRGAGGVAPLPPEDADTQEPHVAEDPALDAAGAAGPDPMDAEHPDPSPDAIDVDHLRAHASVAPRVLWADLVDSDQEDNDARPLAEIRPGEVLGDLADVVNEGAAAPITACEQLRRLSMVAAPDGSAGDGVVTELFSPRAC